MIEFRVGTMVSQSGSLVGDSRQQGPRGEMIGSLWEAHDQEKKTSGLAGRVGSTSAIVVNRKGLGGPGVPLIGVGPHDHQEHGRGRTDSVRVVVGANLHGKCIMRLLGRRKRADEGFIQAWWGISRGAPATRVRSA